MKSGSKKFLKLFVEFPSPLAFVLNVLRLLTLSFRKEKFSKVRTCSNPERGRPGNNSRSAGFLCKRSFGVHFETASTFPNMYNMHPSLYMYLLLWKFGASRWHPGTKVITNCYWTVNLEAVLSRQETLTVEKSP